MQDVKIVECLNSSTGFKNIDTITIKLFKEINSYLLMCDLK